MLFISFYSLLYYILFFFLIDLHLKNVLDGDINAFNLLCLGLYIVSI